MKSIRVMAFRDAYLLFMDAWSLYRGFAGRRLVDREVNEFVSQVDKLRLKYQSNFSTEILVAVANEMSRIAKMQESS